MCEQATNIELLSSPASGALDSLGAFAPDQKVTTVHAPRYATRFTASYAYIPP